ncbi:DUF4153 domain-containing protein [Novosphingobium soli]|uniref:DUF4153 domain-containing protein n=1 Tax=Novosphingobium soli TaxID=574956 RepID=A0ABV6CSE4_9SPHN
MDTTAPPAATFRWKLAPALLVVALGDWMFYQRQFHGSSFGVLALALVAALLAGHPAVRRDRRALAAMAASTVFASALAFDPGPLAWCLFWLAAGMAALLPRTGRFDDGWRWAQRLAWQGLRAPFGPLLDLSRLSRVGTVRRRNGGGLRAWIGLLALPLAGLAVFLVLFSAANPVFERTVSSLLEAFVSPDIVVRAALWTLLFTMAWSLLRPALARRLLPSPGAAPDMPLPGVSVASVRLSLVLFNLLFAVQNLLDLAYLGGLAPLPAGVTLADYAHRGAYPLVATALLAALFVLVTLRPGSDTARSPAIRRLVTLWVIQNVVLVGSSMLRTIAYVEAYSLTPLRIAALAWMALVAFGLGAICWRLLRGRSAAWLINVNCAAAALVLTTASFVDLGAVSARWNVAHAREVGGRGAALDLCHLTALGDPAVLPLLRLEARRGLAPAFRARVQATRMTLLDRMEREQRLGWTLRGQWRLQRARALAAQLRPLPLSPGPRNCDGTLLPPPVAAPTSAAAPVAAPVAGPVPATVPATVPAPAPTTAPAATPAPASVPAPAPAAKASSTRGAALTAAVAKR